MMKIAAVENTIVMRTRQRWCINRSSSDALWKSGEAWGQVLSRGDVEGSVRDKETRKRNLCNIRDQAELQFRITYTHQYKIFNVFVASSFCIKLIQAMLFFF